MLKISRKSATLRSVFRPGVISDPTGGGAGDGRERRGAGCSGAFPPAFPHLGCSISSPGSLLPSVSLYTGRPVFLSFISSKTEDWGYLNEDGELGLAYQGLKQVARSNVCLSSCVCSVLSACVYA